MGRTLKPVHVLRAAMVLTVALAVGCKKAPAGGQDLSTPKAAAMTFGRALEQGDAAAALAAADAGGTERDLVEAMAQSSSGMKRLLAAAHAKFGDDAKRLEMLHSPTDIVKTLRDADVAEDADRATVTSKDGHDSLQLHRRDGEWKVDIGALIRGQDVSHAIPVFHAAGVATNKVADDIESGKCASIDAVIAEVGVQMNAQLPGAHGTQPAPTTTIGITTPPTSQP